MASAKKKYDAALDELEKLVAKRKQLDDKRLIEAYHSGGKTADEIESLLKGIDCNGRGTSCGDQLARAVREAAG